MQQRRRRGPKAGCAGGEGRRAFERHTGAACALLAMLTLAACSRDPNLCQAEQDCFVGESCVQSVCVQQSTRPPDMNPSPQPDMRADMPGVKDLGSDGCTSSEMCLPGWRCDVTQRICVEPVTPACSSEEPCADPSAACVDGECVVRGCTQDEQCGFAHVCNPDGLCEQPGWNLNLTDAMGNAMPGSLILYSSMTTQTTLSYKSDELRVFSNTSATQSASVAISGVLGDEELSRFFTEGLCTVNMNLCQQEVGQPDPLCLPLELSELSPDSVRWSFKSEPLSGGEHVQNLILKIDCEEPSHLVTMRDILSQLDMKMSLEYRRLADEVVKGFVLTLLIKN